DVCTDLAPAGRVAWFDPFRLLFLDPPPAAVSSLSLHDALPISTGGAGGGHDSPSGTGSRPAETGDSTPDAAADPPPNLLDEESRSEEHTSELQSRFDLVCRLLLEKKKTISHPARRTATPSSCPP